MGQLPKSKIEQLKKEKREAKAAMKRKVDLFAFTKDWQ